MNIYLHSFIRRTTSLEPDKLHRDLGSLRFIPSIHYNFVDHLRSFYISRSRFKTATWVITGTLQDPIEPNVPNTIFKIYSWISNLARSHDPQLKVYLSLGGFNGPKTQYHFEIRISY